MSSANIFARKETVLRLSCPSVGRFLFALFLLLPRDSFSDSAPAAADYPQLAREEKQLEIELQMACTQRTVSRSCHTMADGVRKKAGRRLEEFSQRIRVLQARTENPESQVRAQLESQRAVERKRTRLAFQEAADAYDYELRRRGRAPASEREDRRLKLREAREAYENVDRQVFDAEMIRKLAEEQVRKSTAELQELTAISERFQKLSREATYWWAMAAENKVFATSRAAVQGSAYGGDYSQAAEPASPPPASAPAAFGGVSGALP